MFRNTFQIGIISIFFSVGSDPLQLWEKKEEDGGRVEFLVDEELRSQVLQLAAENVINTYIACPLDPMRSLGMKHPHLALQVKALDQFFSFEIHVLDDKQKRRRFRGSNFQAHSRVQPYICTLPLQIEPNKWSSIAVDLADYTRRVYGTNYAETLRIQVHANCRLRRIYFSDKVIASEDSIPAELKLYAPR